LQKSAAPAWHFAEDLDPLPSSAWAAAKTAARLRAPAPTWRAPPPPPPAT
jgi:hypothetical protein